MYRKYRYRLQQISTLHLITLHPPSGAYESLQNVWLGPLSLFSSSLKSCPHSDHPGVASSYTLLPRLPSEVVESAQPKGKTEPLCLLNLCGIVGVELPARNRPNITMDQYMLVQMHIYVCTCVLVCTHLQNMIQLSCCPPLACASSRITFVRKTQCFLKVLTLKVLLKVLYIPIQTCMY